MSELVSNTKIDKQLEFLRNISEIKVKLFRPGIESKFPNREQKKQFNEQRLKWSNFVNQVEIDIAAVLVDRLEQNEAAFEAGIEALDREIQEINDTVAFLNLFKSTIVTLGRIVTLPV